MADDCNGLEHGRYVILEHQDTEGWYVGFSDNDRAEVTERTDAATALGRKVVFVDTAVARWERDDHETCVNHATWSRLSNENNALRALLSEAVRDMEMDLAHPGVEVDPGSLLARMREAI